MKTLSALFRQFGCILVLAGIASAQTGGSITVAGTGQKGFAGDGGPATEANLSSPGGLAVDSVGNLYIADLENQRIRKVSPSGIITTVAGNGQRGFSGDGGKATVASLDLFESDTNGRETYIRYSAGITVDVVGNLYIADTNNHRIRRVGLDGIITTVAGIGLRGYSGDGGAATHASLNSPTAVFVDKRHTIYLAEGGNGTIRKIALDGIITTVGDGYWWPSGVAVTDSGDIYISDSYFFHEGMVFRQDADGNVVGIVGADSEIRNFRKVNGYWNASSILNPPWSGPAGLALNSAGNVFVADQYNQRLAETAGGWILTRAVVSNPRGVATDSSDNVYVADTGNNRVGMIVLSASPKFSMDSDEYCSGDSWRMHLSGSPPNSPIHLYGNSNGAPWDMRDWRTTGVFGTHDEAGTFDASSEGQHLLWASVGAASSNKVPINVSQCGIRLALDSSAYCSGGSWKMRVESGMPGVNVSLIGTSNGESWQFAEFGQTQKDGVFSTSGMFGPGSEGEHSLRVQIGSERSNLFRLTISRCEP